LLIAIPVAYQGSKTLLIQIYIKLVVHSLVLSRGTRHPCALFRPSEESVMSFVTEAMMMPGVLVAGEVGSGDVTSELCDLILIVR
jgi:hypothetical protein